VVRDDSDSAAHTRRPADPGLRRVIDAVAIQAHRSWDGSYAAWNGAFVIATTIGTVASLLFFTVVIDRDSWMVLLGPALAWVALGALVYRGRGLRASGRDWSPSEMAAQVAAGTGAQVRLRSPRWKAALSLIGSGVLVIGTATLGPRWGLLIFGPAFLLAAAQFAFPSTLRLLPDGFTVTVAWHTLPLFRWELCEEFAVWRGPTDVVRFRYNGPLPRLRPYLTRIDFRRYRDLNASLPSTFGVTAAEMVTLLTEAKQAALKASFETPEGG
jgi:hypothetical protein